MVRSSVLYLAPTFLADRRHKLVRGVQVFDFQFVRDLVTLGYDVTVAAEKTWRPRFEQDFAGAMPRVFYTPHLYKPLWAGLWAAATLKGRYDCAWLGNCVRGMVPPVDLMLRRKLFNRIVVQGNRTARQPFVEALRRWPAHVLCLSKEVERWFPPDLHDRVETLYGIVNWREFQPRPAAERDPAAPVSFCISGKLDNDWKGAPLALDAWSRLTPEVRSRCRLHLKAYQNPPTISDPTVVIHPWAKSDDMPAFLGEMDVMLVPSTDFETFSQAMVQGMLAGLPVVTYDLPVLTEKLDAGGGIIIKSADELAAAITRLAADASLRARLGAEARATALRRYCWDSSVVAEKYLVPPTSGVLSRAK